MSAACGQGRSLQDTTLGGPFFGEADHDVSGWLGGVQAGCDYQFAGGWVIGIQSDYAWTDAEGKQPDGFGSSGRRLCRSHPQRYQACGPAGRASGSPSGDGQSGSVKFPIALR
jgi:hypothetical protein